MVPFSPLHDLIGKCNPISLVDGERCIPSLILSLHATGLNHRRQRTCLQGLAERKRWIWFQSSPPQAPPRRFYLRMLTQHPQSTRLCDLPRPMSGIVHEESVAGRAGTLEADTGALTRPHTSPEHSGQLGAITLPSAKTTSLICVLGSSGTRSKS